MFADESPRPEGLHYQRDFISAKEEAALIGHIRALPLAPFQFGIYEGKRRVVFFGSRYDFTHQPLEAAEELPAWLVPLAGRVGRFAALPSGSIKHALCTEYDVGAGIGWHRDKKHFDQVFGLSLASACKFRFRRKIGNSWERFMLNTEPRSLYVMTGASRHGANCLDAGWSRFCQDLGDGPPAQVRHRRSMDRVERWPSPSSGPHRLMRAQLRVPLRLRPRLRA